MDSVNAAATHARRHFSLTAHPIFPALELHPERKLAVPFWNLAAWLGARGQRVG